MNLPDAGQALFAAVLGQLDNPDPRDDIDTESLVRRFPHLAGVRVADVETAGPHGPVPGRVYTPANPAGVGLVWVHGGAFIAGSLDMPESHWVGLELASRGIAVLALDYRKARDGVHHPVLSDDVLAGWRFAANDEGLLGVLRAGLHFGGASAGANLAASATLRLVSEPGPASLILVYPVLHAELPAASSAAAAAIATLPPELRFTPGFMRAVNANYVGASGSLQDPLAFPANGDTAGLPNTLILNADADDLRSSGEAFGDQLTASGVRATVEFEPGTVHGYLDHPGIAAAVASIDRISDWLLRDGVA